MATVNKQSVRDEVDKVKIEFGQLCQAGKITGEAKALMSTLLLISRYRCVPVLLG